MTQFLIGLAQSAPSSPGGAFGSFIPMIAIFAIFYFLVLRPQSRKAKDHQKMLSELKKGEDVVTTGGIIGRITGITDREVIVQVQEGVRLRIQRSAIQSIYAPAADKPKADAKAS